MQNSQLSAKEKVLPLFLRVFVTFIIRKTKRDSMDTYTRNMYKNIGKSIVLLFFLISLI